MAQLPEIKIDFAGLRRMSHECCVQRYEQMQLGKSLLDFILRGGELAINNCAVGIEIMAAERRGTFRAVCDPHDSNKILAALRDVITRADPELNGSAEPRPAKVYGAYQSPADKALNAALAGDDVKIDKANFPKPTEHTVDFELEAVWKDSDGKFKPLDELTYKPLEQWQAKSDRDPLPDGRPAAAAEGTAATPMGAPLPMNAEKLAAKFYGVFYHGESKPDENPPAPETCCECGQPMAEHVDGQSCPTWRDRGPLL